MENKQNIYSLRQELDNIKKWKKTLAIGTLICWTIFAIIGIIGLWFKLKI